MVSKDEGGCLKAAAYTITISQKPTASVASIDVTPLPSLPQTMLTDEQFEQPNRFDDHGQFPKNEKNHYDPSQQSQQAKNRASHLYRWIRDVSEISAGHDQ